MTEIIVKNQTELDSVPIDFHGRIIIKFGVPGNRAIVRQRYINSSVVAWGNSSVEAWGNSSVEAWGNSSVVAWGNSSVVARENSSVVARENSSVVAWKNSSVEAWKNSTVKARENSSVVAWGNSSVVARENSSVVARENSSVEAWENSSVVAWENSSVVAWGNSFVVAWGNSQIHDHSLTHKIQTNGNARIVYSPRNVEEYIDFYGVEHTENTVRLFKAVHKYEETGVYCADWTTFVYTIGEEAIPHNGFDDDPNNACGAGINMAHSDWAIRYGSGWNDVAILELEAEKVDILVPYDTDGKVRARKAKVIREVPLEECGLCGKLLAKRMGNRRADNG